MLPVCAICPLIADISAVLELVNPVNKLYKVLPVAAKLLETWFDKAWKYPLLPTTLISPSSESTSMRIPSPPVI